MPNKRNRIVRRGRIGGLARAFALGAVLVAGAACEDPVEPAEDAGPDAGMPMDAEPADAEPADAEPVDAEPVDAGRTFRVRANGFVPAVGTSSNAARRVQGAIVTPAGGEASNQVRRVRSVIGAPRSGN